MPAKNHFLPFEIFLKRIPADIYVYPETYLGVRNKVKIKHPKYGDLWVYPTNLIRRKFAQKPRKEVNDSGFLTEEAINSSLLFGAKIKYETYKGRNQKAVFIDPEYGEFEVVVARAMAGARHPQRRRTRLLSPEQVQSRLPEELTLDKSSYRGMLRKARFIDKDFGEWWARPYNVIFNKNSHPARYANRSKGEDEIALFIKQLNFNCETNSKALKNGRVGPEIDIYVPELKFGIEYCGLYWHSALKMPKDYHISKRIKAAESGITLFQFYEDEWQNKKNIVKSIIKAKLGVADFKYQARKLNLREVSGELARLFLEENHLMGAYKSAKHLGLFDGDELISLISYKSHGDGIDISRFCNKINTSVAGGFSRLIKEIERRESPKFIQSWVDLRYGTGDSLKKLGFKHIKTTLGWKWTDGINTFNRLRCRANMDERRLSEKEHAKELGWYRIYDAGQALFELKFY